MLRILGILNTFYLTMKKILLLLFALVTCINAWGDEVIAYTLTPTEGSNSAYASNCDVTCDGITWNVNGNAQMVPWRIGGKSITKVDRTVYSKTAIADSITSIVLTHGAASSITVNSLTLVVASNASFSTVVSTVTGTFVANGATTFTCPEGTNWYNCFYKFVYNVTVSNKSSNKFIEFSGAVFNKLNQENSIPDSYEIDLTVGKFGTICLPRGVKSTDYAGATFYNIVGKDDNGIIIDVETGDLVAGKPYIFKATENMLLAEFSGLPVSAPVVNNGLIGNLNVESVPVPADCYVLSGNKLRKVEVAGAAVVGMNRAYIDPSKISNASSQSGIRINFEENEGNETGVDAMKVNENVEVYDIMGRKVTNPTKGIYVINGKKVVIK